MSAEWNPRYVSYALANGKSPEAMQAHDRERHPGASMMEFIIWSGRLVRLFKRANPKMAFLNHDALTSFIKTFATSIQDLRQGSEVRK